MRHRPPKHIRQEQRASAQLAGLVLRGDMDAARKEAERIAEQQKQRDSRAAEFYRNRTARHGA
jgi:hypothetical protein